MTPALPPDVLDRFAVSYSVSCAFATDLDGRVLIVKPSYRDHWQFIGGMVDTGETPHGACAREVREEIGLDLAVGDLLVLDWVVSHEFVAAPMTVYLFDAGVIDDPDKIRLQADELEQFCFLLPEQAASRFAEVHRARIELALEARRTGRTAYRSSVRGVLASCGICTSSSLGAGAPSWHRISSPAWKLLDPNDHLVLLPLRGNVIIDPQVLRFGQREPESVSRNHIGLMSLPPRQGSNGWISQVWCSRPPSCICARCAAPGLRPAIWVRHRKVRYHGDALGPTTAVMPRRLILEPPRR